VKITIALCISMCWHLPNCLLLDLCFSLRPVEVYLYLLVAVSFCWFLFYGLFRLWHVRLTKWSLGCLIHIFLTYFMGTSFRLLAFVFADWHMFFDNLKDWVTDNPFIISPRITFEVTVRFLGGLMVLGCSIAAILKRSSVLDWLEQLIRRYIQVRTVFAVSLL
jgi:hypothetical protein